MSPAERRQLFLSQLLPSFAPADQRALETCLAGTFDVPQELHPLNGWLVEDIRELQREAEARMHAAAEAIEQEQNAFSWSEPGQVELLPDGLDADPGAVGTTLRAQGTLIARRIGRLQELADGLPSRGRDALTLDEWVAVVRRLVDDRLPAFARSRLDGPQSSDDFDHVAADELDSVVDEIRARRAR